MLLRKIGCQVLSETSTSLHADWRLTASKPGAIQHPSELNNVANHWLPAVVPGTVAQTLYASGDWDFKRPQDFDDQDWWYHCRFASEPQSADAQHILRFDGLATLAQAWLNGECILNSDNMFVAHDIDVSSLLQASNDLHICFRALNTDLAKKRPRPRWKTKLVSNQQLRWTRTSLLGRIPGWSPPVAPVGPWRAITLQARVIHDVTLRSYLDEDVGVVDFACYLAPIHKRIIFRRSPDEAQRNPGIKVYASGEFPGFRYASSGLQSQDRLFMDGHYLAPDAGDVSAKISVADQTATLMVEKRDHGYYVHGQLRIPNASLWWPHTHGDPLLNSCTVTAQLGDQTLILDCGQVGFRRIEVHDDNDGFKIFVNGEAVFCRGACWTINDIVSLNGSEEQLKHSLQMAKDAGMNMIRVGGTMVYEQELFYQLCDELGILVWQDFMFANMDYPVEDETFRASVESEIVQQLKRFRSHPCMAMYCGNSEVEQQAAMLGLPQELWRSTLFSQLIPDLCKHWHGDVPYVPSTPSGGTLPFHVSKGVAHYYGVGAYMRPVVEVRRAQVKFTPECLGFANIPENTTINQLMDGQSPVAHHPLWKSRVPRDSGAGWDFEDIRDFYFESLFHENAVQTRCFDMQRYLDLGRITTGEMMEQVFAEWRSAQSNCGGALVWFYKDLWPGAGWGIVDSLGTPKACYYYLRRVWQPIAVVLTDESLEGIHAHVNNETGSAFHGTIEFLLLKDGKVVVGQAEEAVEIPPRSCETLCSDAILGGFYDVSYAYRFGPPKHDVVVVTLRNTEKQVVSEAFYFPGKRQISVEKNVQVHAAASELEGGNYLLTLRSDTLLQAVHFDVKGFYPVDNYFHLAPQRDKEVLFIKHKEGGGKFKGYVESVNLSEPVNMVKSS